jgi:glucokinase
MYLGIEIGGTKLQLGVGPGDGTIRHLWRGTVDPAAGGPGILKQIEAAIPELLQKSFLAFRDLKAVGVGFGGPTDDETQSVIKSHHIHGWDGFPIGDWVTKLTGLPAAVCNDADVAGLAEARFGAGKGYSPVFYITVGSGIGGGLILDGKIYRGVGKGAAEIGHLRPVYPLGGSPHDDILEHFASGWGIGKAGNCTGKAVAEAAVRGERDAVAIFDRAAQALAEGICSVIKLLCPRLVVIGGGVSLVGEDLFFQPIRRYVTERGFAAFAGLTEIVPAALGEEVVVQGALALARDKTPS